MQTPAFRGGRAAWRRPGLHKFCLRALLSLVMLLLVVGCGSGGPSAPSDACGDADEDCVCTIAGCDAGFSCNALTGRCEPCTLGSVDCNCAEDGTCHGSNLLCEAETERCVSTLGRVGGECFSNRTCLPGGRCEDGSCVACAIGWKGCACFDDHTCAGSLRCSAGICDDETVPELAAPPANPVCYSPCQSDLQLEAGNGSMTVVRCSEEGLMAHCLDTEEIDRECVAGSCAPVASLEVDGGAKPRACESDLECPDFQACIQGGCYSNCEVDSDCSPSRSCYRQVCRLTCDAKSGVCPEETYCSVTDGEHGYCLPLRESDDAGLSQASGSYSLSADNLRYSNTKLRQSITLRNESAQAVEFTIAKVEHTVFEGSGSRTVRENPLPFLLIGGERPLRQATHSLVVGPGEEEIIGLWVDSGDVPNAWNGVVELQSVLGNRRVSLNYAAGADGRWAGKMYYFAQFGDEGLAAWIAARGSGSENAALNAVGNAFVQHWGLFRRGGTIEEFEAMLSATLTESWRTPQVADACRNLYDVAACYLFVDPGHPESNRNVQAAFGSGLVPYSDNLLDQPVPSGRVELPVALDIRAEEEGSALFHGRIATEKSLHYAGDPAVLLRFTEAPRCPANATDCRIGLERLDADIVIGGRSISGSSGGCAQDGFEPARVPWLLPGFLRDTEIDPTSGQRVRHECRDALQPFGVGEGRPALNLSLSQSNPIPDGRSRVRKLSLVDGMLVNQEKLYVLFKESFDPTFLGDGAAPPLAAYGIMVLDRTTADLEPEDFVGFAQSEARSNGLDLAEDIACSGELVQRALGDSQVTSDNAEDLVLALLDGLVPEAGSPEVQAPADVHYLCHETGLFDQGSGGPVAPASCPAGSRVTFFVGNVPTDLSGLPCQSTGSCARTLEAWQEDSGRELVTDPIWRCTDPNEVFCSRNRTNLVSGKTFYRATEDRAVFVPLLTAIDQAFVYKTRFRSRQGTNVGFAPEICRDSSTEGSYCYDPTEVEGIEDRVDCLMHVYDAHAGSLGASTTTRLQLYLDANFSYTEERNDSLGTAIVHDGFERLYSELLIMLGDEAFTQAFQARFDLAGAALASFVGSEFEPNGIDLAGVAGHEMRVLYQATQAYQMVLDRFYRQSPYLWRSVQGPESRNYVSLETVVSYFDRVLRASSQKSRAFSEIGKRYQALQRPDLARFAVERAYTAAYLESVVITSLMKSVIESVRPQEQAQIRDAIDRAQLTYRAALLDMREVYENFTDEVNAFGFAPDYIPFPALAPTDANAFVSLLDAAKQSLNLARDKEEIALQNQRGYDTDRESFRAELIRINNNYEAQLGDICGTFVGEDGVVRPATRRYAHLDARGRLLGDPCGFVGNGQVDSAMGQLELLRLDAQGVVMAFDRNAQERLIEEQRLADQCSVELAYVQQQWEIQGDQNRLQREIEEAEHAKQKLQRRADSLFQIVQARRCITIVGTASGTDCVQSVAQAVTLGAYQETVGFLVDSITDRIEDKSSEIRELERSKLLAAGLHQCEQARVNSEATIQRFLLDQKDLELEALRTEYRIQQALSSISGLRNEAERLLAEQQESEQLTINIEAARNDPNVRIYKNDAVLNADRTFFNARQAAYRATKVFEYYTSQSYARLGELALVRLVSRGDYNLENYLVELEQAFREFGEVFGAPQERVEVLSLRDDILAVPHFDDAGNALSLSDRVARFRASLTDASRLDNRGRLSMPFSTSLRRLSPLTRNHKLTHVQADIIGSDVGDTLGRVALVQVGTGAVRTVADTLQYYRLPARQAVINSFFNGTRRFEPQVYQNFNLRDRPLVNTYWKLVFDGINEHVNRDINLQSLTDIRLYLHYSDFTSVEDL